MTQLGRRIIYLTAGAAPACFGVLMASALGGVFLLGALAGTTGLLLATAAWFPVARPVYWSIAVLLGAGLAAMLPYSLAIGYGTAADLVAGTAGVPLPVALGDLTKRAWVFYGPVLCAVHFLWKARCAPNNSFKPNPLRGSA